jgi:hypothetical protein
MNLRRINFLFICFLILTFSLIQGTKTVAQQTKVEVSIDVPDIMIGEQTMLHVQATINKDKDKQIQIPMPAEALMKGVEVLGILKPDTSDLKNNYITIRYDLVITSFDSALYLLPPFVAIEGQDTVFSNQVALKVSSPDVNLDKPEEYYDIKKIWRPAFVLADYYAWIYGVLFLLFLICVTGYLVQRLRNRPEEEAPVKEAPKRPPHEQAILELKEVREQKLWQQGRNKEYYTAITDILKRYITARYDTSVLERTSAEILEFLRYEEPEKLYVYDTLKQIVQLADFVKFAKLRPLPDENDITMINANVFVEQTKQLNVEQPPATEVKGEDNNAIKEEPIKQ